MPDPRPRLLISEPDFRHRKMLVNFARKLAVPVADAGSVEEARIDGYDWSELQTAVLRTGDTPDLTLDAIDRIRHLSPDACVLLMIDNQDELDLITDQLPVGVQFLNLPITLPGFRVALENCAMIHRRSVQNHSHRRRTISGLVQLQEELLHDTDVTSAESLTGYFAFAQQRLRSSLDADGLVVLKRRDQLHSWRVEWSNNQKGLRPGTVVRDIGDLTVFFNSPEPSAIQAERVGQPSPVLRSLAGNHLLILPERVPVVRMDFLWIVTREKNKRPFQAWETGDAAELVQMCRLGMDGALATSEVISRFSRYVASSACLDPAMEPEAQFRCLAEEISAAAGGDGFVLSGFDDGGSLHFHNVPRSLLPPERIEDLNSRLIVARPNETIHVNIGKGDDQLLGMLVPLTEDCDSQAWMLVRYLQPPHRLEEAVLITALPTLVATREQLQH